ncbi:MAG: elongation factor G [Xanthomonadales bacterium]|nr:elongation factor G [Xanthomonadales bacterium]
MPRFAMETIRNIALAGHPGGGKTTLFEALLQAAGAIQSAGSVERGNTVSDHDPMEKDCGHSLNTSVAAFDFQDTHFNLIDTPGYPDFRGPTLAAMAAVETVAVVINAAAGVEHGAVRLMERAARRHNERMIIVNRIDADGVDMVALLAEIQESFGKICLPINLPAQNGTTVVDCFFHVDGQSDLGPVADFHQQILDQVVEVNPDLMEHYLEEGEESLSAEALHDAFEQCLREGHLVPICFTSARTGAGVQELLDAAIRLLPNPAEGNPPEFLKGEGDSAEPVTVQADTDQHVVGHVFKIINDPYVGKLSVFRLYQGTVRRDTQLYIGDGRKPFKVGHLFKLFGKDHSEIDEGIAGDICAVAKVEEIHYDAVLHDSHDEDHFHLRPVAMPSAMFGLAIEPATRGQEQKLSTALHKLGEEDPCLRIEHHAELNETVMMGLGDLHLRVMLERLRDRFGVDVQTRPPRIAYRETVSMQAEGHHRHKKQTGGAGQFGEVSLRVRPLERDAGFQFVDAVVGGAIPHNLIPAVEKGVHQVLHGGAIAGYPLQDIEVTVHDGKHHPVDSKEVAFVTAGKKAFLDAIAKARPILLEPIVLMEVTVPEHYMGDVTTSLAGKRGRINGTDSIKGGEIVIQAQVPQAEIGEFPTELKAMTQGQGRYSMELSHYDPVPAQVQKQLMDAWSPKAEED